MIRRGTLSRVLVSTALPISRLYDEDDILLAMSNGIDRRLVVRYAGFDRISKTVTNALSEYAMEGWNRR